MRNHRYVSKVLTTMISLNSSEYIADIDEMITSGAYNNDINIYLSNISNLLNCYLLVIGGISDTNRNQNNNNPERIKNTIITNLFRILAYTDNNEGKRCCDKLINENFSNN